jgi:hypothetical protein
MLLNQRRMPPTRSKRNLLRTREHVWARVRTRGTLCAPAHADARAWLQLAWLRHAQRCSSRRVRDASVTCQAVGLRAAFTSPRYTTRPRAAQYSALYPAARCGSSFAPRCAKLSGMRHLLRTREHPCAPVRTRGTQCAPAGANAHAWLQLAWLRRIQRWAAPLQHFTCQAVAGVASNVRPASRHDSVTRADWLQRLITSCALRQLVRTAMCEMVWNAVPAAHP